MVIVSSAIPPAPRGSGARSVPAVNNPARQTFEPRRHHVEPPVVELRRAVGGDAGQTDGDPYIDAEFIEVLREAAETARTIEPLDDTVRRAIEAYRTADGRLPVVGAMLDVAS